MPEVFHAKNHVAVAKVAALLPVNANEIDCAAHFIAARIRAEETLRLVRRHAVSSPGSCLGDKPITLATTCI